MYDISDKCVIFSIDSIMCSDLQSFYKWMWKYTRIFIVLPSRPSGKFVIPK